MSKLLINLTTAKDNADKTTVAFVVANAGVAAGQEVVIFLNVEAVRLATPGYADDITSPGFKPLKELLVAFTENGGKLWVCPPCFQARGLQSDQVVAGATFAGGAAVVEFLGQGAASLSY
ncbi:MAG: DsrE family protein [Herpetosiphonaceae bacterium]|nr:DsrE family protein [Herpetosiphonaceae bacterium]